jgi:hypothetical protein
MTRQFPGMFDRIGRTMKPELAQAMSHNGAANPDHGGRADDA